MIFYRKIKSLNFTSWEKRQRLKKNFVLSFSVFCYDEQKKKKRTEKLLSTRFKEFYHRRRQGDRKMRGGGQGKQDWREKGRKKNKNILFFVGVAILFSYRDPVKIDLFLKLTKQYL